MLSLFLFRSFLRADPAAAPLYPLYPPLAASKLLEVFMTVRVCKLDQAAPGPSGTSSSTSEMPTGVERDQIQLRNRGL